MKIPNVANSVKVSMPATEKAKMTNIINAEISNLRQAVYDLSTLPEFKTLYAALLERVKRTYPNAPGWEQSAHTERDFETAIMGNIIYRLIDLYGLPDDFAAVTRAEWGWLYSEDDE